MTHLFGCVCNKPERIVQALEPVRSVLVAAPPVTRRGLGYIQGGEVLLSCTPRRSDEPVDFFAMVGRNRADYIVGYAAPEDGLLGTANTQPFRYRRWLFAQETQAAEPDAILPLVAEVIPEFLRRSIKGQTLAEHVFSLFLAELHPSGAIDSVDLPPAVSHEALTRALAKARGALAKSASAYTIGNLILSNGRSLIAARLDKPLYVRRLLVPSIDRGKPAWDPEFKGVLALSSETHPGAGFEEIPQASALFVNRDLTTAVTALSA